MDDYGDMGGSDELTNEEIEDADQHHEELLAALHKVVNESDEAKAFLSTAFGLALRKTLAAEKLRTMRLCAENIGKPEEAASKHAYDVIRDVERIFGLIISNGKQALEELRVLVIEGDDDER